ncbi:hypothetical protein OK074_0043 [Actinobacteria bacterium OK074]|nr:hypothetical protein OK074_0043 [Actinobacteria bacterium OK074]
MAASSLVPRLRRRGGDPSSVRVAAARAGVFPVAGTALAVAGHRVVFDVSPSWAARGVLAGLLFLRAFPWAGQPSGMARQLVLTSATQALGVYWFGVCTGATYERFSLAWRVAVAHVVMSVLLAFLLRGAQDGRLALFRVAAGAPVRPSGPRTRSRRGS